MKKAALIIALILSALALPCLSTGNVTPEHRALWVDGWHAGIFSQAEADTLIDLAYNHGHYNVLVPQVRKKADAMYISHYGGPDGTGEPMAVGVQYGFDPLGYVLQQAHARGMEVHPWLCTHRCPTTTSDWFYNSARDWLTKDSAGNLVNSEGYYLDPGVPRGEEYTVNVILDLVKNYDIDGIQWDRIRYPQQNSGYNDIAIQRFRAEPNCNYFPAPNDSRFSDWRRAQLNAFVARVYAQIMEIKPWVKVGANTFQTYSDAYGNRFQDWDAWMANKWLDANQPMIYTSDINAYDTRLKDALGRRYGRYVYAGMNIAYAGHAGGVTQISHCRSWDSGYGQPWGTQTYSHYYATGSQAGWYDYVAASSSRPYYAANAPIPDMPWKSAPTKGIILGRVTDAAHPNDPVYSDWIYKATVTLTASGVNRSTTTDGTGYFVFTEVDPKLASSGYTITCSKSGYLTQSYSYQAIAAGQVLRADFELSATSNQKTITSPAGTICAGSSWFSLPIEPVNGDPTVVLPGIRLDSCLYAWDNATQSQLVYDEFAPFILGDLNSSKGYELFAEAPYTISYTGYRGWPNRNITAPSAGSSFIGCPFESPINWEDIMVTNGSTMVPMRTASKTYGWLSSTGFWWNSAEQSQYDVALPEDWPSGGTQMLPWHGYWIYTNVNGLTLQLRQAAP